MRHLNPFMDQMPSHWRRLNLRFAALICGIFFLVPEAPASELLKNGAFTNGLSHWNIRKERAHLEADKMEPPPSPSPALLEIETNGTLSATGNIKKWQRIPHERSKQLCNKQDKSSLKTSFRVFSEGPVDRESTLSFTTEIPFDENLDISIDADFHVLSRTGRAVAILEFQLSRNSRLVGRLHYYLAGTPGSDWFNAPNALFTDAYKQQFFSATRVLDGNEGHLNSINIIDEFNQLVSTHLKNSESWQELNPDKITVTIRHDLFVPGDSIDIEYEPIVISVTEKKASLANQLSFDSGAQTVAWDRLNTFSPYDELSADMIDPYEQLILVKAQEQVSVSQSGIPLQAESVYLLSIYAKALQGLCDPLISLSDTAGNSITSFALPHKRLRKGWKCYTQLLSTDRPIHGPVTLNINSRNGLYLYARASLLKLPRDADEIRAFLNTSTRIPILDLEISKENLLILQDHLNRIPRPRPYSRFNVRVLSDQYKKTVPARLIQKGIPADVQVRYRGLLDTHWTGRKRSFKVSFDEPDKHNGLKAINLIVPEDDEALFYEFGLNLLNKRFGLYCPENRFVAVFVNQQYYGVYWQSNDFDKVFLEKNLLAPGNLYKALHLNDGVFGLADLYPDKNIGWWKKKSKLRLRQFGIRGSDFSDLQQLIDVLETENPKAFGRDIANILDLDQFARWMAYSMIIGDYHLWGTNMMLYFNQSKGLFEFMPWDVIMGEFYFQIPLEKPFQRKKQWPCEWYPPALAKILTDPELQKQIAAQVKKYVSDKESVLIDKTQLIESLNAVRIPYYLDQYADVKAFEDQVERVTDNFINNIRYLTAQLSKTPAHYIWEKKQDQQVAADPYPFLGLKKIDATTPSAQALAEMGRVFMVIDTSVHANQYFTLKVHNAGNSDIVFNELSMQHKLGSSWGAIQLYRDTNGNGVLDRSDTEVPMQAQQRPDRVVLRLGASISKSPGSITMENRMGFPYFPEQRECFFVKFRNEFSSKRKLKKATASFYNSNTNKPVPSVSYRYINSRAFSNFSDISMSAAEFETRFPLFEKSQDSSDEYILPAGTHLVSKDILIPKGIKVTIQPGTTIKFGPKASLFCYGTIEANGTKNKPIRFTAIQPARGWGVIGVLRKSARGHFKHCVFEYGSEDYINGTYLSGMLSAYHAAAVVADCVFQYASAVGGDDALNFKGALSVVRSSLFLNNRRDAIDYDFMAAGSRIEKCVFFNNKNDAIDLSGSETLIISNHILSAKDKGLSIGERSRDLIFNNAVSGCNIGIAVKDLAQPRIVNNTIINNEIGIAAYQKKPYFGGGQPLVQNTILDNRRMDFSIERPDAFTAPNTASACTVKNSRFTLQSESIKQLIKEATAKKGQGKRARFKDLFSLATDDSPSEQSKYAALHGDHIIDAGGNVATKPILSSRGRRAYMATESLRTKGDPDIIMELIDEYALNGFNLNFAGNDRLAPMGIITPLPPTAYSSTGFLRSLIHIFN